MVEVSARSARWEAGLADALTQAAAGLDVLVLSPETRIVLTGDNAVVDEMRWQAALGPAGGCIVDVSHAWRRLDIDGPGARDLLERAVEIDLDPRHFPIGSATRTLCARVPVILVAAGTALFRVHVATSYAAWLQHWLDDALQILSTATEESDGHDPS
jgi:sarcosine oxidase subunit gamma